MRLVVSSWFLSFFIWAKNEKSFQTKGAADFFRKKIFFEKKFGEIKKNTPAASENRRGAQAIALFNGV
jgi:hypothetical protein